VQKSREVHYVHGRLMDIWDASVGVSVRS